VANLNVLISQFAVWSVIGVTLNTRPDAGKLKVEILSFDGCPTARSACSLVEKVLKRKGVAATVVSVKVADYKAVKRLRFFGSPTIRIDGKDIEREKRNVNTFTMACRLYKNPGGSVGLPPDKMVSDAIDEAVRMHEVKRSHKTKP